MILVTCKVCNYYCYDLCGIISQSQPSYLNTRMPLDMESADDVNFLDKDEEALDVLLPTAPEQTPKGANLFVNESNNNNK